MYTLLFSTKAMEPHHRTLEMIPLVSGNHPLPAMSVDVTLDKAFPCLARRMCTHNQTCTNYESYPTFHPGVGGWSPEREGERREREREIREERKKIEKKKKETSKQACHTRSILVMCYTNDKDERSWLNLSQCFHLLSPGSVLPFQNCVFWNTCFYLFPNK